VQQRIEVAADIEIAVRERVQVEVRGEDRSRHSCHGTHVNRGNRREHHPGKPDEGEHRREPRQQPLHAAPIERRQVDPVAPLELSNQCPGDDETRNREEDVDARESAGQADVGVKRDDHQDGDRAQALDVEAPALHRSSVAWTAADLDPFSVEPSTSKGSAEPLRRDRVSAGAREPFARRHPQVSLRALNRSSR